MDQNDVRNKAPKNWDEVMKIQQVLEAVVRSYARVTARPPPIASPYRSYRHQRAVFQRASDHYWQLEGGLEPPPALAGPGASDGPVMSIIKAQWKSRKRIWNHLSIHRWQRIAKKKAWDFKETYRSDARPCRAMTHHLDRGLPYIRHARSAS